MDSSQFAKRLQTYIDDIKKAGSEQGKAFLFLEFVREVFKETAADNPHSIYPDLERYLKSNTTVMIKGFADALLGNLIIEFESNLQDRKITESEEQLRRYTAILWNNKGIVDYVCMSSEGLEFRVYRPRSAKEQDFEVDDIVLDPIDKISFESQDASSVFKWLDRYILYKTLIPPTTEDIVSDFGSSSPVFKKLMPELKISWAKVKKESLAIYNEWAKYLSIVYGAAVDSESLFLKHTYLATLAKIMVYSYYSGGATPTSKEEIEDILKGGVFKKWGIENFLEEDFFVWIVRGNAKDNGIEFASNLIDSLERYNLTKMTQDVLKGLYQQLVDPADRHDLGEFYTPDWLAELIVNDIIEEPSAKVLDPSCGSGTFLAAVVRQKIRTLRAERSRKLIKIIETTAGIDVHPLAVMISKANYLMSLGDLIKHKTDAISIPVYMADSILFPQPTIDIAHGIEVYLYPTDKTKRLAIPKEVVDGGLMEKAIDVIKELAMEMVNDVLDAESLNSRIKNEMDLNETAIEVIAETIRLLRDLIISNSDTIYPFILKNVYKPAVIGRFDYVVGNPPWLTYHDVRSPGRQRELKDMIIKKYNLLGSEKDELFTHMELATLFFARCADIYLNPDGVIAFVMPNSLFASDHHHNIRTGATSRIKIGIRQVYDLEKVSPIFKLSACVIVGKNNSSIKYPLKSSVFKGKLPKKDLTLESVDQEIKNKTIVRNESAINLLRLGDRSAWHYEKIDVCQGREIRKSSSTYLQRFKEGATLVPRPFWFIEVKKHEHFGIDANKPLLETSRRAIRMTKEKWKDAALSGKVEKEYLFSTLLASDMLPFSHLPYRLIVLPVFPYEKSYAVLDAAKVKSKGDKGMFQWLNEAAVEWNRVRKEKAENMTIYQRLDKNRGITDQNPSKRYKVLFVAIGTYMCACVADSKEAGSVGINGKSIKSLGFVADYSSIYFETAGRDEAYYLAAILNSTIIDSLVKPFQAKGLWGERNLWKKPLELPIPEFDKANEHHLKLSELAKKCEKYAEKSLPALLERYGIVEAMITPHQIGRLRSDIRQGIKAETTDIDKIVCRILT